MGILLHALVVKTQGLSIGGELHGEGRGGCTHSQSNRWSIGSPCDHTYWGGRVSSVEINHTCSSGTRSNRDVTFGIIAGKWGSRSASSQCGSSSSVGHMAFYIQGGRWSGRAYSQVARIVYWKCFEDGSICSVRFCRLLATIFWELALSTVKEFSPWIFFNFTALTELRLDPLITNWPLTTKTLVTFAFNSLLSDMLVSGLQAASERIDRHRMMMFMFIILFISPL